MAAVAASSDSSLLFLVHSGCPVSTVAYGAGAEDYATCSAWLQWAINRMGAFNPTMVVVSTNANVLVSAMGAPVSEAATEAGLLNVLRELAGPNRKLVVIGDPPILNQVGPDCLAAHSSDVQTCSTPPDEAIHFPGDQAQIGAVASAGGSYVDPVPWFCTTSVCPAVIGQFDVYENRYHATSTYAASLATVLQLALGLQSAG